MCRRGRLRLEVKAMTVMNKLHRYIQLCSESHEPLPKHFIPVQVENVGIKIAKYKLVKIIRGNLFDNYLYKLDKRSTWRYIKTY
jgi:hypothetical protein